jgi:HlyD family secretion protein
VKKVQHPTGGIVAEIFVKEGDLVAAGQPLLRLDDTLTKANFGIVRSQLDEFLIREARLVAERDEAEFIAISYELAQRRIESTGPFAVERKLFEARKNVRLSQRAQLRERILQSNEEIRGLSAQIEGKQNELEFIAVELAGVSDLYAKKLVTISRVSALQRDQARLRGDRGQFTADIARARGKIGEIELQILQQDQDFRNDVLKDLRETQGKIAEIRERVVAAEDQLQRVDLRAPTSGLVHQLAVHTVGGVIGNGETIMLIVPQADQLMVEAKVAPPDIDQVALGSDVVVRITAGNQRTAPDVAGTISHISADLTRDAQVGAQPSPSYYLIRVSLSAAGVAQFRDLRLVPGMQAEAFIQTNNRTPLQYLVKPLRDQIARTFRER